MYPQNGSTITLNPNEKVTFGCQNAETYICKNKTIIEKEFSGVERDIRSMRCLLPLLQQKVKPVAERTFGYKNQYKKYQIGFAFGRDFLPTIYVYFSLKTYSTAFVRTTLSGSLAARQKEASRRELKRDYCCDEKYWPVDVYDITNQKETFANLLCGEGSTTERSCNYIDDKNNVDLYLVPSQLAPKSHFVYTLAGSTTFYYLNTAPQWKSIKYGNWDKIEKHVLKMAAQLKKDLVVCTGVYGHLQLRPGMGGKRSWEDIFMYYDYTRCTQQLPVPLYFWKLVYEPSSNRGMVFVTVNNPFIKKGSNYHVCRNPGQTVMGQTPAGWNPQNIKEGYSYMCAIEDFIATTKIDLVDKLY